MLIEKVDMLQAEFGKLPRNKDGTVSPETRIALVLPGYPTMVSGIPSYAKWLVESLAQSSDIWVIVPCGRSAPRRAGTQIDGARVYDWYIPMPVSKDAPIKTFLRWCLDFPRCFLAFRRFLRREGITSLHGTFHSHNYLLALNQLLGGQNYAITLHGSETVYFDEIPPAHRLLSRAVIRRAAFVVTVSDALGRIASERFPEIKTRLTIYNGIRMNPSIDRESAEALLKKQRIRGPYVLLVGRLHPVKGVDLAIYAWQRVLEHRDDLYLLVVGGGAQHETYQKLIERLGCSHRVHLVGACPNEMVHGLLQSAELLVLPSRSEGFGGVLLEAGIAGIPVVASRVGGVPEIVLDGQHGCLVPPEDPEALAQGIIALMSDEEHRLACGQKFADRIRKEFDSNTLAGAYLALHRALLV